MFRNAAGKFQVYQFLYEQAEREKNPIIKMVLMKNFNEFRAAVRLAEKKERQLQEELRQRDATADEFIKAVFEDVENLRLA